MNGLDPIDRAAMDYVEGRTNFNEERRESVKSASADDSAEASPSGHRSGNAPAETAATITTSSRRPVPAATEATGPGVLNRPAPSRYPTDAELEIPEFLRREA